MITCSIEGCNNDKKYSSTGWCQTHYHRYWRTGSVELADKRVPSATVTYVGAHARVKQLWGSAKKYTCVLCGGASQEWAYDGTDPEPLKMSVSGYPVAYSAWPEFYMPLCTGCHRAKDAGARFDAKTTFGCGHLRSEANTYTPPSKPRCPECRTCRTERSRKAYLEKGNR